MLQREKICFALEVSLLKVIINNIFHPELILSDEVLPPASTDGYFTQQHNDPKKFMEDHMLVKIAPVPSCQQIARKDYLWRYYKVSFLSRFSFMPPCMVENVDKAWS